jgi:hypothetical protein
VEGACWQVERSVSSIQLGVMDSLDVLGTIVKVLSPSGARTSSPFYVYSHAAHLDARRQINTISVLRPTD